MLKVIVIVLRQVSGKKSHWFSNNVFHYYFAHKERKPIKPKRLRCEKSGQKMCTSSCDLRVSYYAFFALLEMPH